MKEYAPVRHVIEKYKDSILDQDKIIEAANNLWELVDLLKQNEKSSFSVFQHMVRLLHKVLTLSTKSEIQVQLNLPAPQAEKILPYLEKLHDLAQTRNYWIILSEIQSSFSTQCIKEAMKWMTAANKKTMLLQYNKENNSAQHERMVGEAANFKKLAEQKYQQVSEFCSRYRVV